MTPYPHAKILVVDDEISNVILAVRALERVGYRHIIGETDSLQAVTRFRDVTPDLVILDLLMPGKDGYAVLEELRETMRGQPVPTPVLILTADVRAFERCWTMGARDFLTKPLEDLSVLWARVETLLEIRFLRLELLRHQDDGR